MMFKVFNNQLFDLTSLVAVAVLTPLSVGNFFLFKNYDLNVLFCCKNDNEKINIHHQNITII